MTPATDKDQVSEMINFAHYLSANNINLGHNPLESAELACRLWIRQFAAQWRQLQNTNPLIAKDMIRIEYPKVISKLTTEDIIPMIRRISLNEAIENRLQKIKWSK